MFAMEHFGDRLAHKLAETGMATYAAAKKSGVDYAFLCKIIKGDKAPSLNVLNQLQQIPELAEFVSKEKVTRILHEYDADSVLNSALHVLGEDPKRASNVKCLMKKIFDRI